MKALIYLGKERFEYRDAPDPVLRDGCAIVRVEACGICGSDMHGYHGDDPRRIPPMIMGHEAAGVVETGPLAGRRVAVNPFLFCGHCNMCQTGHHHLCEDQQNIGLPPRPGAFAERVLVPESNLVEIPDQLDTNAAALAEPLAVAWHAVSLSIGYGRRPLASADCVVLGGGAIGLGVALSLAICGARSIRLAEPNAGRRAAAKAAHPAIDPYDPAKAEPLPASIDLVFDAVGASATREASFKMVKRGGAIIHLGLMPGSDGVDVRRATLGEIAFVGSYCYTMTDFRETVALLADGRFGSLGWIEERPMSDGLRAFGDIDQARTASAKIILRN